MGKLTEIVEEVLRESKDDLKGFALKVKELSKSKDNLDRVDAEDLDFVLSLLKKKDYSKAGRRLKSMDTAVRDIIEPYISKETYKKLGFGFLNEGKKDYEVYHESYTSAVDEILTFIKKNGYEISDDEVWNQISTGPGRPKKGQTTRHTLELTKNGKVQRKALQAQIYNMGQRTGNTFELNMYIS